MTTIGQMTIDGPAGGTSFVITFEADLRHAAREWSVGAADLVGTTADGRELVPTLSDAWVGTIDPANCCTGGGVVVYDEPVSTITYDDDVWSTV